jgi:hypothetical protein
MNECSDCSFVVVSIIVISIHHLTQSATTIIRLSLRLLGNADAYNILGENDR